MLFPFFDCSANVFVVSNYYAFPFSHRVFTVVVFICGWVKILSVGLGVCAGRFRKTGVCGTAKSCFGFK